VVSQTAVDTQSSLRRCINMASRLDQAVDQLYVPTVKRA